MPTNLPPEYFEAEKRFRLARSPAEKIACLEEMLSLIPKHKGTDHLRADYRRQLSKLKSSAQAHKKTGTQPSAFRIPREGAGQIAVIGATNTGKSSLVAALTNAEPEISEMPYTTRRPLPGMMAAGGAPIQLIDTPPLDRNWRLEPELIDLIRRADLILLVVDLQADPVEQLEKVVAILEDNAIIPAHRRAKYHGSGEERQPSLKMRSKGVDAAVSAQLESRLATYHPVLVVANKCDDESLDELCAIFREMLDAEWLLEAVSARTGRNLDRLKQVVFDQLGLVRIYAKPPGRPTDLEAPFVLRKGATVEDLAGRVHKDILENLKFARVWGSTAFDGQMVQRDYVLHDGDIVELHT
jgi:hypothetical protein